MINFTEGEINLDQGSILMTTGEGSLDTFAKKGLVERREDNGGPYYYLEASERGMRFAIFISLREKRIEWLRLHWLDSPMKGWDDVSEKGVQDEYDLLSNFVEDAVGGPPDSKKSRRRMWRFTWGQLEVCYDLRAFQADIFMKPR